MRLHSFLWNHYSFACWQVQANFPWIMNTWVLSLFWRLWSGVWHNANCSQAHLQSLIKPYYLPCSVDYLQEEKQPVVEPLLHIFSKLVVQGLPRVLTAYEKHCDDKHVCLLLLPLGLFLNTIKAYLVHNSFEIVVFSAVIDAFLCLSSPLM